MRRTLTRIVLGRQWQVLAMLAVLAAVPGAAQDHRNDALASGERGRTYHEVYGKNLVALLPAFRLQNLVTEGSADNLARLVEGRADLGFVQADVYALGMRDDRARHQGLTLVARLRDECIFMVRREAAPVRDFEDLAGPVGGRTPRIAVGAAGSGMPATWRLLSKLDPALADAEVSNVGGALALNQLAAGLLDAVAWVTDPLNHDHTLLRAALAMPEVAFMPLADPELDHAMADGTQIYQRQTVALGPVPKKGPAPPSLSTLCTSTLVLAREGANPRLVEATAQVLSLDRERVFRMEGDAP